MPENLSSVDFQKVADFNYEANQKEHAQNCQVIDDHISHIERAQGIITPAQLASRSMAVVEGWMAKAANVNWSRGEHVQETTETPSPQGGPSAVRKVLKPLAAAATGTALALGAWELLKDDAPPATSSPSSIYQYLEDGGWHVPAAPND